MKQFIFFIPFIFFQSQSFSDYTMNQAQLRLFYDSLSHPVLDESKAAIISNCVIMRGGQQINFLNGTLRLCQQVHRNIFEIVFTGSGTFTLSPPTPVERGEFERQSDVKLENGSHTYSFTRAVLWFSNSMLDEIGKNISFQPKNIDRKEEDILKRSTLYATDKDNENVLYHLINEFLQVDPKPYLFAHFFTTEGTEIFFAYDLRRYEEIAIYQPPHSSITGAVWWLQLLNSFHLPEEYHTSNEYQLTREDKHLTDILDYRIDLDIEKSGDIKGNALVHFRTIGSKTPATVFFLDPILTLDSIASTHGERINFLREEKSWACLVTLPQQDSSDYSISFSYQGKFLELFQGGGRFAKYSGSFYQPSSSTGWYPSTSNLDKSLFSMTFHFPDNLQLIGPGKKTNEKREDHKQTITYTTTEPSIIASFSLGDYKMEKIQLSDKEPPVFVYDIAGGDPMRVGKDVANSLRLFTGIFGGVPYPELKVTAGPLPHGQAFQDFLHLPWFEEFVGENQNSIALGRVHEVAHAWWGHGVGWQSYHDQWISEGFAQYSALLYAPFVLKDDRPFLEKLKEWREEIAGTRKFALGSGPALGSIWIGYRSSTSRSRTDYFLAAYHKGAYLLHMLRMMLLDLTTFNEDKFKAMMSEFYQSYQGKETTTEDFKNIVEKHFHADMNWFFDQWIFKTEIPTLKCSHSITQNSEGKWLLTINIEQKEVTQPFKLFLPFKLVYNNGTAARARLFIDDWKKEFSYTLDKKPEEVTFNIMESVLCTIEE